jgi:hypothetical protein
MLQEIAPLLILVSPPPKIGQPLKVWERGKRVMISSDDHDTARGDGIFRANKTNKYTPGVGCSSRCVWNFTR